jgi:hypothetical protein
MMPSDREMRRWEDSPDLGFRDIRWLDSSGRQVLGLRSHRARLSEAGVEMSTLPVILMRGHKAIFLTQLARTEVVDPRHTR